MQWCTQQQHLETPFVEQDHEQDVAITQTDGDHPSSYQSTSLVDDTDQATNTATVTSAGTALGWLWKGVLQLTGNGHPASDGGSSSPNSECGSTSPRFVGKPQFSIRLGVEDRRARFSGARDFRFPRPQEGGDTSPLGSEGSSPRSSETFSERPASAKAGGAPKKGSMLSPQRHRLARQSEPGWKVVQRGRQATEARNGDSPTQCVRTSHPSA